MLLEKGINRAIQLTSQALEFTIDSVNLPT